MRRAALWESNNTVKYSDTRYNHAPLRPTTLRARYALRDAHHNTHCAKYVSTSSAFAAAASRSHSHPHPAGTCLVTRDHRLLVCCK